METRNDSGRGVSYEPSTQPAPPVEKASVFEDFIDIFHAPSSVFARRAAGGYAIHLIIITIVTALITFANRGVMGQIAEAEFARRGAEMVAKNPQLTQEALDQTKGFSMAIGQFFSYAATPIIIFIMALFTWALARWVAGAKISYGQAAMITTLAWIPRLLGLLAITVQVALMDTSNITNMFQIMVSPARFMDADTPRRMLGALAAFELFSVWSIILAGIGIAVVGKVPRVKAMIAVAILFVLGSIPLLFA